MPFGLTNSPAVFMDLMNRTTPRRTTVAKFPKCNSIYKRCQFLGHMWLEVMALCRPQARLKLFKKLETPKSLKESAHSHSLNAEMAFQTLKDKLCNAPVLALLDGPEDFVVYCDASCQGLGYVLMQKGKVIAYASRQLKIHEKNTPPMIWNWVQLYSISRSGDTTYRAIQRLRVQNSLPYCKILAAQNEASEVVNAPTKMLQGLDEQMEHRSDGALYYMDQIWVPLTSDVRTLIMNEAHKSRYYVHLGADKMYYDLKDMYWWPGMKKDIALYVRKCLTCSKVKTEHHRPSDLLQQLEIP
ncbi:putative reverse transcriptase domain-containing protein [Tanacetum coccineum]